MKKALNCAIFAFWSIISCQSQTISDYDTTLTRRSSIFIEIGGNSTAYSLNYDYILSNDNYFRTSFTIGFAAYKGSSKIDIILSPQLNVLIGRTFCSEIGFGYSKSLTYPNGYAVLRFGMRFQKTHGGFFGRFAFTPILKPFGTSRFLPWFGASIGYTIKRCQHPK